MDEFEDPRLTELRPIILQALELAGHTIVQERQPVDLPTLSSALVGHIQSRDSNNQLHSYFVRPASASPAIPEWISATVRASHALDEPVPVHVVVERAGADALSDAQACGAGLLLIEDGGLEQLLEFSAPAGAITGAEFRHDCEVVRREIVSRAAIEKHRAQTAYFKASNVAQNAGPASAQRLADLLHDHAEWVHWEGEMKAELEVVESAGDPIALGAFRQRVGVGTPGN